MLCCLLYVDMLNRMFKVKVSVVVVLLDELESGALRADDAADLRLRDLLGSTACLTLLV